MNRVGFFLALLKLANLVWDAIQRWRTAKAGPEPVENDDGSEAFRPAPKPVTRKSWFDRVTGK